MTEILYTGKIPLDQLEPLIKRCNFPTDTHTWVMAEQLPSQVVENPRQQREELVIADYFSPDFSFARYTSGRIFQEESELRWKEQDQTMQVVCLGSDKYKSALQDYGLQDKSQMLSELIRADKPKYHYLLGRRIRENGLARMGNSVKPGTFADVQFPRLFSYPVEDTKFGSYERLKVCEYIDQNTGEVALFRFQEIKAVSR